MKRIIIAIIGVIVSAILLFFGIKTFKNNSPRERTTAENGVSVIVENLGYYCGATKVEGKVMKPADENGNYPDSLGSRPMIVFFHDPMKASFPEGLVKSLAGRGLIGYVTPLRDNGKTIPALIKRIKSETFCDNDLLFIIADSYSSEAVVKQVGKIKGKLAGLVLFESNLDNDATKKLTKLGFDVLQISSEKKGNPVEEVAGYLELKGAMK